MGDFMDYAGTDPTASRRRTAVPTTVLIDTEVKTALRVSLLTAGVSLSALTRAAYDLYLNDPDFRDALLAAARAHQ